MKKYEQNPQKNDLPLEEYILSAATLVIARMIKGKKIDASKIRSKKKLFSIIEKLGSTEENAFEIHIDRVPEKIATIRACIDGADPEAAVILLYTLIESEVNSVIRILLRIHGYSHAKISNAIRGVDFKSKLDVFLPLLGVDTSPRIRQLAFESQAIRNSSVHFKALPTMWSESGNLKGDHDTIVKKALEFIGRNSIDSVEIILTGFVNQSVSQCQEVQQAYALFDRFRS